MLEDSERLALLLYYPLERIDTKPLAKRLLDRFGTLGDVFAAESAPLREFDGYSWYDAPLDEMPPEFRLVICDGPPGTTKGGRYGLVPMIGARLAPDATILLDDAERPGEREVLDRWRDEAGLQASVDDTPTGTFAIVAAR